MQRQLLLLTTLVIAGTAAASQDAASISIPPLSIRPPEGNSWQVARRTETGVVFRRALDDSSYSVAYVQTFYVRSSDDPTSFLKEVKANIASSFVGGPNAKVVDSNSRPTNERGYPCVIVRSTFELAVLETSEPELPATRRQARILLCRVPGKDHIGFAVGFTYTASTPKAAGDSEAESFLNGVGLVHR